MTASEPKTFDGAGTDDEVRAIAKAVLDLAINDEIDHRGAAAISETLACFIECRIADALRKVQ
jgi:hypothetical protein